MIHRLIAASLCTSLLAIGASTTNAQLSGLRGGVTSPTAHGTEHAFPTLSHDIATGFITIEGQAELRVTPSEIRIVLAVTAEGTTPAECKTQVNQTIQKLKLDWQQRGIAEESVVEDFIAVLPRYDFTVETVGGREVAVEKKSGYLMQTNLHVAVPDDARAMQAVDVAFENGVSDIIAFDYWNKELDELKVKAREAALKVAQEKSNTLMNTLFSQRPRIINLQESTKVYYPESMYESFINSSDAEYQATYSRRDIPQIRTFRPKNTYYRGLDLDADITPRSLPMQSEISVVSTVRLYYESPSDKEQ